MKAIVSSRRLISMASMFVALGLNAAPPPAAKLTPSKSNADPSWLLVDSAYRATVTAKNGPSDPDAGWAIEVLELGATLPELADVALLDSSDTPVPIAKIFRAPGQNFFLIAKGLKEGEQYKVYFGGTKPLKSPTWEPKHGLFVEFRRLIADMSLESPDGLSDAWKISLGTDGAAFTTHIGFDGNPFGESKNYIARYRGWLKPGVMSKPLATVSSGASFVWIGGKLELMAPGDHTPQLKLRATNPEMSPSDELVRATVNIPAEGVMVDYLLAKGEQAGGLARFGFIEDEAQMVLFEGNHWARSGKTEVMSLEHAKLGKLPRLSVKHEDYLGWEASVLFDSHVSLEEMPDGWNASWILTDGAKRQGSSFEHVFSGMAPIYADLELSSEKGSVKLKLPISTYGFAKSASLRSRADVHRYLEKMGREEMSEMEIEQLTDYYKFAKQFGDDAELLPIAKAWITKNPDPDDRLYIGALIGWLRGLARIDAKAALDEAGKVGAAAVEKYLSEIVMFEMDTRTFVMRDDSALAFAKKALPKFESFPEIVQLIRTRIGDLLRVQGKLKEAEDAYRIIQKNVADESAGRKFAAQDRAYAATVASLIARGLRSDAEVQLILWEREHPLAKLQSDFLLLRAQVLLMFGRASEALLEIDSFKALNPESPFQIPADFHRACALAELGQKDAAVKIWSFIAARYPKHELAAEAAARSR
jgi:tetratricopeptide (TPR) repeat protein